MDNIQDIEVGYVHNDAHNRVGFYLTDTFNLLPMAAALEPLRIANRVTKDPLFHWSFVTDEGQSVKASNGISHSADYSLDSAPDYDFLVVTGPFFVKDIKNPKLIQWVQHQHDKSATLIGLESGCHTLAKAGLLADKLCTTHWEHREEFRNNDHELAASVADRMIHPHIRNSGEPQTMDIQSRIGVNHPVVIECIQLIEANIEQPLLPDELAELIGISKRQLERLFLRYMKTSPARYYLTLRLEAARLLLEESNEKIVDIAKATGFRSAGHFSTRYQSSYGITPSAARNRSISKEPA